MRVAVLLTTYDWTSAKRLVADRLSPWCNGCDLFVLVDESLTGPVDTAPYKRLGRSVTDYPARGLPAEAPFGIHPLSWCNDYAIYDALRELPQYDVYVIVEDDVAVNVSLRSIADRMIASKIDCVVCQGPDPDEGWIYASQNQDLPYTAKSRCLMCMLLVSRPTALKLFEERTRLGLSHLRNPGTTWAGGEGFIASALVHLGSRTRKLAAFGDMSLFSSQYVLLDTDPRVRRAGVFAHSVLELERFERKFERRAFDALLQSGKRQELGDACAALRGVGRWQVGRLRLRPSYGNLALLRPARQSSLHRASRKPGRRELDPYEIDAGGAVSGVLTGKHGFQTNVEQRPWWQVDLGDQQQIGTVRVFNSHDRMKAARALSILVSADGKSWREVYRKTDERVFGGPDDPFVASLDPSPVARFVRIQQNLPGILHFDEVEIFGEGPVPYHA